MWRSGCVTCKAKRLKCDEIKPTCQQCHKRQVECGGYKKNYKWRAFEEATFTNKPTISPSSKTELPLSHDDAGKSKRNGADTNPSSPSHPPLNPPHGEAFEAATAHGEIPLKAPYQWPLPPFVTIDPQLSQTPTIYDPTSCLNGGVSSITFSNGIPLTDTPSTVNSILDDDSTQQSVLSAATSFSSGRSPQLVDFLLPGIDLAAPPPPEYVDFKPEPWGFSYQPEASCDGQTPTRDNSFEHDNGIEEIPRYSGQAEPWLMRLPSPCPSDSSGSSEGSQFSGLCRQPRILQGSPEMLVSRFVKQTCGILSVKDGPSENPWRTMVWPLALSSPSLYHAISSMTIFHTYRGEKALKMQGVDHMTQSIRHLASGIKSMRIDTALATTLVLAFSESWDQHTSTGIKHLRGAKMLVKRALEEHHHNTLSLEDLDRFRFLCNTWVYMDVIARLTSVDDDDSNDFDAALMPACGAFGLNREVDPLMGCASTLFPLIGRVANLVRKVMRCPSNTVNIVSQANELKAAIEAWEPPSCFEAPEDPTSEIQHSLQTAEAYRWATLLYLHQAVPEVPSMAADQLAKQVLLYLATVPLSSRAIIVHIYPLLVAGCEAIGHEERAWVEDRWAAMVQRMSIGNLNACWEVINEVWNRRDADEAERCRRMHRRTFASRERVRRRHDMNDDAISGDFSGRPGTSKRCPESLSTFARPAKLSKRSTDVFESIDHEKTVRGRLHWVDVMKQKKWEGESMVVFQMEFD